MANQFMDIGAFRDQYAQAQAAAESSNRNYLEEGVQSQAGVPIPYLLGRRRIKRGNLIWSALVAAGYETVEVVNTITTTTPMRITLDGQIKVPETVTETQTIQVTQPTKLEQTMMIGICLGPNVQLRGIYQGDVQLWSGTVGPNRAQITFGPNAGFLANKKAYFHGGNFDQPKDPLTIDQPDQPNYTGLCYILLEGVEVNNSTSNLSFEVQRFPNPLGLAAWVNRDGDDINPATAMYCLLTEGWGAAGGKPNEIDTASFRTLASRLYNEKNFCSLVIEREEPLSGPLGTLQAQTHSLVFHNPQTAKVTTVAIRASASIHSSGALVLGEQSISHFQSFDKTSWASVQSGLHGQYADRDFNYNMTPVYIQNSSYDVSVTRNDHISYPYVTRALLCMQLLGRDLSFQVAPYFTATVVCDRTAADLIPGDIVILNYPKYQLWSVPAVVTEVARDSLEENTVVVSVNQLITPELDPPTSLPEPPPPREDVKPYAPASPMSVNFLTAPFWIARLSGQVSTSSVNNVVFPMFLPTPANEFQASFYALRRPANTEAHVEFGTYPTYGLLEEALDRYEGFETGLLSSPIIIRSVINPIHLGVYTTDEQKQGRCLIFLGDEILSFASVTPLGSGRWALNSVRRGLIDTVARSHAAGSRVFIMQNYVTNVGRKSFPFPVGSVPTYTVLSRSAYDEQKVGEGIAATGWTPQNRTMRSPRPHDTRIGGVRSPERLTLVPGEEYTVSWRTRTRGPVRLSFQNDAAEDSEVFHDSSVQLHRVYVRDSGNSLRLIATTASDKSYNSITFTMPSTPSGGQGALLVRSVSPFGESIFDDELPVTVWKGSDLVSRYSIIL